MRGRDRAATHDVDVLIVFVGRPGTGKTTLARLLAAERRAAHVRVDAIEAAIVRSGEARRPVGPVGYLVSDPVEHRRRVEGRRSDLDGLTVPSWAQVMAREYEPWDEGRDGPRLIVRNDSAPVTALPPGRAYVDRTG